MTQVTSWKAVVIATGFVAGAFFLSSLAAARTGGLDSAGNISQVVPFVMGTTHLSDGDNITIEEIRGTSETFAAGNVYEIKGSYKLASHEKALLAANIAVHAQGFALMQAADREKRWGLDLAAIARVWRGGCIIRSRLLTPIARAAAANPPNLLRDPALWQMVQARDDAWRRVVGAAVAHGVPVPAFASSWRAAIRTFAAWC